MTAFDELNPAVQHHIVNSLGWNSLRPLQEATIIPVLKGEHAILLAPTAGGKTEAACFPILSRMLSENWSGLSVLYICPIKALLNNLNDRLRHYGELVGRRVEVWHGDVSASRKAKIISDPPDFLLTTPESLEVMLVSKRVDHAFFFRNVRTFVVDEIHAFAGDDRGWHLLSVIERISSLAGREIQRIGLSATVGNPGELCNWLAGNCESPRQVINPPAENDTRTDVKIDWVGSLHNAATVISRLHRGEKRLVFVDSRSRVEQLSMELRTLGVKTFVSHSSLSIEERSAAEEAFSQGNDCVIVATSTLELGIDVGDLDRVIQIDSPSTVSSFLQRIGRTGRRSDSLRNCLFLATKEDAFLQAVALLSLWESSFVEPVMPPVAPYHIFAQQVMALTLQTAGTTEVDIRQTLMRMPGFAAIPTETSHHIIEHMITKGILHSDEGVLGIGNSGERNFGYQNFMELFSVFTSPPMVKVFHGKTEIGEVHELTFAIADRGPCLLTLGGRSWATVYIDWARKKAFVEPTDIKGRSQWLSPGLPLHFEMCQAIQSILYDESVYAWLSKRAIEQLEISRDEFSWLKSGSTNLVIDVDGNATWWTFAGAIANAAIADTLALQAEKVTSDNLAVNFKKLSSADELIKRIREIASKAPQEIRIPLDTTFIQELKFSECLPQALIDQELSRRYDCSSVIAWLQKINVAIVHTR